jgi:translation initiation factor 1 (eIF-1/SUI1)
MREALTDIIAERNGRKTLTTVQGLPKKFDQKKILKVIKKKFGMLFYRKRRTS